MLKKYRRKEIFEAEQFDGSEQMIRKYHIDVFQTWNGKRKKVEYMVGDADADYSGRHINVGDWIIKKINDNQIKIIKADTFKGFFEEVE